MTLEQNTEHVRQSAAKHNPLGGIMKFKFPEGVILLDGSGDTNQVSNEDIDSDCTMIMKLKTFEKVRDKKTNPMTAVLLGKIKVKGDASLALKIKSIL